MTTDPSSQGTPTGFIWRKGSRSANNGACVQVARNVPGVVAVRDSKDPEGPALGFAPAVWATFIGAIKADRHNG